MPYIPICNDENRPFCKVEPTYQVVEVQYKGERVQVDFIRKEVRYYRPHARVAYRRDNLLAYVEMDKAG